VKLADLGVNIDQSVKEVEKQFGDRRRFFSQRLEKYLLARYIVEKELSEENKKHENAQDNW
jgi:hypothetical protein